jgi:hypothetical protein
MTAAEVLAEAATRGFLVNLNSTGDGLILRPGDNPPADVVSLIRDAKTQIVAHLQTERRCINHWIADKLIDWPPSHCLHCRKPIIVGQLWTTVSNGAVSARFHQECHGDWLGEQEVAARRALWGSHNRR